MFIKVGAKPQLILKANSCTLFKLVSLCNDPQVYRILYTLSNQVPFEKKAFGFLFDARHPMTANSLLFI